MPPTTFVSGPRAAAVLFLVLFTFTSTLARAQATIKVNDDVNLRFGILGQFQGEVLDDPLSDEETKNLFVRRVRLLVGGQVAKNVTFFIETDSPNLGRTLASGKNIQPSTFIQDAFATFTFKPEIALDAGLMFVPFSRNSVQSAATLLPIDYGTYTFTQSAPTQSSTGRDTGFQARGSLAKRRLEYRIGAFQGLRDPRSHNGFRVVGRAQYNLLDTETGFFYTGTYLGAKKIVAVGGAFDAQESYDAFDVDAFVDLPVGRGAVTAQIDFAQLDGGTTLVALPKQRTLLAEAGYLIRSMKLTPVVQFVRRDVVNASNGDEHRLSVGINYWWAAHHANVKGAYTHVDPAGQRVQHQLTVQLQIFYY